MTDLPECLGNIQLAHIESYLNIGVAVTWFGIDTSEWIVMCTLETFYERNKGKARMKMA